LFAVLLMVTLGFAGAIRKRGLHAVSRARAAL
jgi:hypothetical protein